jgi:hypothetical protein
MKISAGGAHDLFVGLNMLEQAPEVSLEGMVRLKVAINMNILRPYAAAYELARTKGLAQIEAQRKNQSEGQVEFMEMDAGLRAEPLDLDLKTLSVADLKLETNKRVTGPLIAQLATILTDLS